jgi:hypothetical protein
VTESTTHDSDAARRTALARLETLSEAADMFGRMVDLSEISSFDGPSNFGMLFDEATGQSRAFIYPGSTAAVYINETELKQLRANSRAFAIRNPYWLAVEHNIVTHVVGTGHAYKVVPKDPEADASDPDMKQVLRDAKREIDAFCRVNRWGARQAERRRRLERDGEFFLRFFDKSDDGILRVRFVEPLLVATPPSKGPEQDVWFGIQYAGDYEDPQGYYIRPANYLGSAFPGSGDSPSRMDGAAGWAMIVPPEEILHRTANVDMSSPRGLPTTFFVMTRCRQALRTLSNMGALVEFRAKIALIRKHVNATVSTVKTLLSGKPAQGDGMPSTINRYPQAAILDTNDQTTYEFPSAQTDVDKIAASIQAELRSVAAAIGLPEYMVSADASNANFSSTMVAEGPAVKTFQVMQQAMIDDDLIILKRALDLAAEKDRLPSDVLELIDIDAEPPLIISRDRLKDTQADAILAGNKVLSRKSWSVRNNLDAESEQQQIKVEGV